MCRKFVLENFHPLSPDALHMIESDSRSYQRSLKHAGKDRPYSVRRPDRVPGLLPQNSVYLLSKAQQAQISKSLNLSSLFMNSEVTSFNSLSADSSSGELSSVHGNSTAGASTDIAA